MSKTKPEATTGTTTDPQATTPQGPQETTKAASPTENPPAGAPHVQEATLADLLPDPNNAREHTPRNMGMIVDSLRELGAARSIVIDEDNVVLAGNGVVEGAGEIGLEKVIIVEATGNEIVAVRRRGLTDEQKADLALRDNRAGELSTWSPPVLKGLAETMDLSHLFYESELDKIIRDKPTDEDKERAPDMALKLDERYNYVVLLFRDQPTWDRACDVLKVQKVTADHGGVSKVGLGRVLDGKPIVDALQNAAAAAKESK